MEGRAQPECDAKLAAITAQYLTRFVNSTGQMAEDQMDSPNAPDTAADAFQVALANSRNQGCRVAQQSAGAQGSFGPGTHKIFSIVRRAIITLWVAAKHSEVV